MKRPHIYGDETKCRAALSRYIKTGEDLLAQADGVRKRIDAADGGQLKFAVEDDWAARFRKWFKTAHNGMGQYLQEQYDAVLRVLFLGLPPDTGKPRHEIGLDNGVPWLRQALAEMRELQDALGGPPVRRAAAEAPAQRARTRWFYNPWVIAIGSSVVAGLIVWLIVLPFTR
jgi:hypothetical protein